MLTIFINFVLFSDELIVIELLQMREYGEGAIRLASYCSNAREFLFPYPQLAPAYASNSRELLMSRTLDFPVCTYLKTLKYYILD